MKTGLAALLLVLSAGLQAQFGDEAGIQTVSVFTSLDQMRSDSIGRHDLRFTIKDSTENAILVKRFINPDGHRFNDIYDIYGISHGGKTYLHAHYLKGLGKQKLFLELDIIGKYGLFLVHKEDRSSVMNSINGAYIAPLITDFVRMHHLWLKEDGGLAWIYFVDLTDNKRAKTLKPSDLIKIVSDDSDAVLAIQKHQMKVEDILQEFEKRK